MVGRVFVVDKWFAWGDPSAGEREFVFLVNNHAKVVVSLVVVGRSRKPFVFVWRLVKFVDCN